MMLSSDAFSAIAEWNEVGMAQLLALFEEYNMLWDLSTVIIQGQVILLRVHAEGEKIILL